MTITNRVSLKSVNGGNTPIADVPDAPTIGTATAIDSSSATITYTAAATGGAVTTFTATSTPGSITATGSSPITVTGLDASTAYTFKVKGTNSTATGPESAASNSINTPAATRGLFAGGVGGYVTTIDYVTIATTGNATSFGALTIGRSELGSCASATRGLFMSGLVYSGGYIYYNTIDYVTIASTGNATDFGDLSANKMSGAACSSSTRGLFGGGYTTAASSSYINVIDYVTIANTGNATDFGDLTAARGFLASCSSTTRGIWAGGNTNSSSNVIDYVTIASTGNATDFGDLTAVRDRPTAFSSSTRGVITASAVVDVIEYVTIASTGNATDFGDLTLARASAAGCSSSVRGITAGGYNGPPQNIIDYVTIATTGNATDFGDLTVSRYELAGCSNGHGGL